MFYNVNQYDNDYSVCGGSAGFSKCYKHKDMIKNAVRKYWIYSKLQYLECRYLLGLGTFRKNIQSTDSLTYKNEYT